MKYAYGTGDIVIMKLRNYRTKRGIEKCLLTTSMLPKTTGDLDGTEKITMRVFKILEKVLIKSARTLRILAPIPPLLFDISTTERIVEYAWVLMNMAPTKEGTKILDVGCYGTMFPIMLASQGFLVTGIDLKEYEYQHPNFRFVRGDILNPPKSVLTQRFDVITSISSIEHVGLSERATDCEGDVKAVKIVRNLLKDGGTLFFSAGFGGKFQFHHHPSNPEKPFGRLYDQESIEKLFSEFKEEKRQYFIKIDGKWKPCGFEQVNRTIYPESWTYTKSIICLKLKK